MWCKCIMCLVRVWHSAKVYRVGIKCLRPPGDITDEYSCFRAEHDKFTNCSSINVNNSSPVSAHVKQASLLFSVITFLNCKWFIDLRFILYLWFYVFWTQVLCFCQIRETNNLIFKTYADKSLNPTTYKPTVQTSAY